MAITLTFQTTGLDPRVTHFNVYRRRPSEGTDTTPAPWTRVAQLAVIAEWTDTEGQVDDQYYYTFFDNVRFLEGPPSTIITARSSQETVTVTGFVIGIDGAPITTELVDLNIHLVTPNLDAPVSDGQFVALTQKNITADATGMFVIDLVPNDRIYPANTFYKIEYLDKRFFKTLRLTDGRGQLFTSLRDANPLELR
jgi:hypothetical protein